eukprot:2085143-Alexandrium_andersonii.AAC.1
MASPSPHSTGRLVERPRCFAIARALGRASPPSTLPSGARGPGSSAASGSEHRVLAALARSRP